MTKEQKAFIEMIGEAALKYYPIYRILPSLTIAQAILESNWGKSGLSKECYNFFGMKWTKKCGTAYKEYKTKEQRPDGSYCTIIAKFRKYPDAQAGIKGYYEFLSGYKRYSNLKNVTDAERACDLIRQDGWATSLTYAINLKKLVGKYNLRAYDVRAAGIDDNAALIKLSPFTTGNYVVTASALKVRRGPGTEHEWLDFSEMTENARKVNSSRKAGGKALYVKGITFSAKEIIEKSEKEYWAKTPSGYVALMYDGNTYVRKK